MAILVNETGACSIQDGCGVLVNTMFGTTGEKNDHIHTATVDKDGFGFTSFEDGHRHEINDFNVKSADRHKHDLDRTKLVEIDSVGNKGFHQTIDSLESIRGNKKMDKTIDYLIANCDCWTEDDRETLNKFDENKLNKLKEATEESKNREAVHNAAVSGFEDQQGNNHTFNAETQKWETKVKEEKKEPVANTEDKPKTADEWLAEAPPEIREDLTFARNEKAKQKSAIIEKLLVNVAVENKPSQIERLNKRSIEDLQSDLSLMPEKPVETNPTASYLGQNVPGAMPVDNVDRDDILPLPVMDYSKQA